MKKIILSVMFILVYTLTAVAGSVPEDLLHEDGAEIFFAEVLSVGDEVVELSPVKKIKGDVKPGTKQFYKNPSAVGSFDIKPGNVYLVTYFDEHNPTEIFDVTDYDTKKLKLKNITGDMWERFEKYLNEGRYEKADMERIDRKNKSLVNGKGRISLSDYMKLDRVKTKSSISVYSGPDTAEAEREYFIKLADSIILEKINTQDLPIENWHGIYLSAAENKEFVFVSSDGKVCKSNPLLSIVPNAEYIMKSADMMKLRSILSGEENLPSLDNPKTNIIYGIFDNPKISIVILSGIILAGILGFAAGYIIRKGKNQNKNLKK